MKNRRKVRLFMERLTSQEAMVVIRRSNLVDSMKLHALIFAAAERALYSSDSVGG
jgi:hypothetical protein